MKQCVQTEVVVQVMKLLTAEEFRAMEAAKRLITMHDAVDPELLTTILVDSGYKRWSKITSAYVLGFLPVTDSSRHHLALRDALVNSALPTALRTHSAEALGNLHDEGAAALLEERLLDASESLTVGKWCLYALVELGSAASRLALQNLASTHSHGTLARELRSAGLT